MLEKRSGHFSEERFNNIEPGPMFGRVNIDEAIGASGQVRLSFFGDMR